MKLILLILMLGLHGYAAEVTPASGRSNFEKMGTSLKAQKMPDLVCDYDRQQTSVSSFQKASFCSGANLKFCVAAVQCWDRKKPSEIVNRYEQTCMAVSGKCPARLEDCKAFKGETYGEEAFAKSSGAAGSGAAGSGAAGGSAEPAIQ